MDTETNTHNQQLVTISLEIIAEDPLEPDIALISAVRDDTLQSLEKEGYEVASSYTGKKGVGPTIDIITFLLVHKDALDLTSDLFGISGGVVGIASGILWTGKSLRSAYQKRVGKDVAKQFPVSIVAELGDAHVKIDNIILDKDNAEATALLIKELANHPTLKTPLLPQGTTKVTGSIPNKRHKHRKK